MRSQLWGMLKAGYHAVAPRSLERCKAADGEAP